MEEVIHPVEEVIHTLVILVSAQVPSVLTLGLGLDNYSNIFTNLPTLCVNQYLLQVGYAHLRSSNPNNLTNE